jgi:hypothetical protein
MYIPQSFQNSLSQSQSPSTMSPYCIGYQSPFPSLVGKVFNLGTCGAILVGSIYFICQNAKPAVAVPPKILSNNKIVGQNEIVQLIRKFKQENPQGFDRVIKAFKYAKETNSGTVDNEILGALINQVERACSESGHDISDIDNCSHSKLYNDVLIPTALTVGQEATRLKYQQVATAFLQVAGLPNYAKPAAQITAQPGSTITSNSQIAGKWESNWGLVVFNSDLTGYWNQGDGTGKILDGSYNPTSQLLVFHYYQPWNGKHGTATLILSNDGNSLRGQWTQGTGLFDSGSWTMTRASVNSSVAESDSTPFKKDPISFTKYLNSVQWESGDKVYFQNLGNCKRGDLTPNSTYGCNSGYVTITNPMGTKICSLRTNHLAILAVQYSGKKLGPSFAVGECRYK